MHSDCEVTYKIIANQREYKLITQALAGILPADAIPEARELNIKLLQQRANFLKDQAEKAEKAFAKAQEDSPKTP